MPCQLQHLQGTVYKMILLHLPMYIYRSIPCFNRPQLLRQQTRFSQSPGKNLLKNLSCIS